MFYQGAFCGVQLHQINISLVMQRKTISLSETEYQGLVEECDRQERTQNEIIREAVREYLERKKQQRASYEQSHCGV